jgi:hypothetical protein
MTERTTWRGVATVLLAACSTPPEPEPADTVPTCAEAMAAGTAPTSMDELPAILAAVQAERVPELDGVEITLGELSADDSFFVANLDLSTASRPGPERAYTVNANPRMFEEPGPPFDAVYAILVHELKHIVDYVGMPTDELVTFGLWYASGDVAEYERETDEFTLERGCATGLKSYRVWLYDRIDAEAVAGKRRDYYTPEEIDAWVADN